MPTWRVRVPVLAVQDVEVEAATTEAAAAAILDQDDTACTWGSTEILGLACHYGDAEEEALEMLRLVNATPDKDE